MTDIALSQPGVLYHVTIGSNLDSIWSDGIDPHYSKGKFEASWYVTKEHILWAVLHVAHRHDCKLDDIFVCSAVIQWSSMRRTNKQGRFCTQKCFQIEQASPALWYVYGEN